MSFLRTQVSFPSNLTSIFSAIKHNSSLLFWLKHYILWSMEQLKSKYFRFSGARVKILQIPDVNFEITSQSSSNFVSFFIVITHNFSADFKFINFLLSTKGPHKSSNFDTFECSSENLSNFSCHFSNYKSVFLQILHHSSVA